MTGAEVSELYKQRYATSKHSETIRNRITELKEMGVICENGVVDCQFTGRSVMSFCTTNNLPEKLEKKETLNNFRYKKTWNGYARRGTKRIITRNL